MSVATGRIVRRSKVSYTVIVELGYDPVSKRRLRRQRAVRGSRRDAEEVLRQMLREADEGAYSARSHTLAELVQEWLDHVRLHREHRTWEDYRADARRILEALGSIKVERLRPAHVQAFLDRLLESGRAGGEALSPGTVQHIHRTLRAALGYAVRMGLLSANPASRVTLPRRQRVEPQVLTRPQIQAVLDALRGSRWWAPIWLVAVTGMRAGEMAAARWEDVDWQRQTITVRRALKWRQGEPPRIGDVKGHAARVIYLRDEDMAVLRRLQREQRELRLRTPGYQHPELICARPDGGYLHRSNVTEVLRDTCRQLGLPVASLHDLRHSHGSILLAEGWDLATVSRRLGHSSVAFTASVYLHELPDAQQRYLASDGQASSRS